MNKCKKDSSCLIKILENGFYKWGIIVASNPWCVILVSVLFSFICSLGLINFTSETDPNKLWIPKGSSYLDNKEWLSHNFPQDKRVQTLIFQAEHNGNILSPKALKQMMILHNKISSLHPENNASFNDICERYELIAISNSQNLFSL